MEREKILIGWAKEDITPDRPVLLHGQHYARVSKYVNDPVTATSLAIESEKGEQLIFLSCDLVYLYEEVCNEVREYVKGKLPEIDVQKISFGATHTHTGPTMKEGIYETSEKGVMSPSEYTKFFVKKAGDCIIKSWQNRKEGMISYGLGHAVVGHNRRATYFDGSSKMYGNTDDPNFSHIEGYEDHSVNLLFTWDKEKKLTGMIINIACPSQETENAYFISADFWHDTREEIYKRYSKDIFILPQCSPAGDQSPHLLIGKKEEGRMLELRGFKEKEEDIRMSARKEIGRRIANAVDDVLPYTKEDMKQEVEFKHIVKTINLPMRMVTEEEVKQAKQEIERLQREKETPNTFRHLSRNKEVIERYEKQKENPYLPMELHVIRLGDIAFATNRFELFLDYGIRIKARSKAVQTFLIQLSNGGGTYLPTERAVKGRSYGAEIVDNLVGPEGGQVIVEETLKEINNLFE